MRDIEKETGSDRASVRVCFCARREVSVHVCVCGHGQHPVSGPERYMLCNLLFQLQVVHSHMALCLVMFLSTPTPRGFYRHHRVRTHLCICMQYNHNRFRLALPRATFPFLDGAYPLYFALPVAPSSCLLDLICCPYLSLSFALPPYTTPYRYIHVFMFTHVYA